MPFSTMKSMILGKTIPPSDTLHRMIVSGGGSAVVVRNIQDIMSPLGTVANIERINVIITASSTNEGNLTQLSTFFTEKGLNILFLTPMYVLDKISRISLEGKYIFM
jgi:hypothetical protein